MSRLIKLYIAYMFSALRDKQTDNNVKNTDCI